MEAALALFRAQRQRTDLSQRDIGERINRTQSWVSRHLDGSYELSLDDFLRLCHGLNMDPITTLAEALKQ